jgi:PAS domain S-box-containing protein
MREKNKTKKQLIDELTELRVRVAKLENSQMPKGPGLLPRLRRQAEEQLEANRPVIDEMLNGDAGRLVHELRVHQVELELQNEELRSALRQLEESHAKYSDLYDFAPVSFLTLDKKGLILEANLTTSRLLGLDRSSLLNTPFSAFIAIADGDRFRLHLNKVFKSEERQTCEVRLRPKGDGDLDARFESIFIKDDHGKVSCRTSVIDITAEKVAKANSMLKTVFDGISDPLLMLEKDSRIRMLNEAACNYFRIANREEAIGKIRNEVTVGASGPRDGCDISSAILGGKKTIFERKGVFDPERIEQITLYPVDDAVSAISGVIVRISDITEIKNIEKQLIRADRLSSLAVLAGGMAHEIRNPLQGINLFIDVLSDEEKFGRTAQEQGILDEIKTNIKRIEGIIKRVLDLSRQSATVHLIRLDVSQLVENSLKLWQSMISKNGIQLKSFVEENLPEVQGDPIEIEQVLTNLIHNAIEAIGKNGTLSIRTQKGTLSFDNKRRAVIFKVQDSGPGIPVDQHIHIFNPFFTTKYTGTGLGLAISHRIVSRHGGLISFESVPGSGTTFTVELPSAPME